MSAKTFSLFMSVIALSGCASIIEGSSQEIVVNTNPPGASCVMERNGMPIGTVNPTPSAIVIKKTKYDILVKCNLAGYQEATYFNKSSAAAATFGNIILGGGIGWAIDSASGSDNKYDSPVNITLVPVQSGQATSAPASAPAATTPPAAEPAPAVAPEASQAEEKAATESDYPTRKR